MTEYQPGYTLADADIDLLQRVTAGGHTFRPSGMGPEFEVLVERLLGLRSCGFIQLREGRLSRTTEGRWLVVGPCDLTEAGRRALDEDQRLGPRVGETRTHLRRRPA